MTPQNTEEHTKSGLKKLISYLVVTDNYILKEGDECCFGLS